MGFFKWLDRKMRKFYVGEIYEDHPEVRAWDDVGKIVDDKSLTKDQKVRKTVGRLNQINYGEER